MKRFPIRIPSWLNGDRRARAAARANRDEASIANIDRNAAPAAATIQSASDASAEKAASPADEGGEG